MTDSPAYEARFRDRPEIGILGKRLEGGERMLLGLAGAPGSGKSTYAAHLAACFVSSVVVPMDGFHLSNAVLERHGFSDRKGAIDTFDVGGYVSLLRRIRARNEKAVYAPDYRRGLEEGIAASVEIRTDTQLVIMEGNYLLAAEPGWRDIRDIVDEVWFIDTDERVRLSRLIDRHVHYGRARDDAVRWAASTDAQNARLVADTRHLADRIVPWE